MHHARRPFLFRLIALVTVVLCTQGIRAAEPAPDVRPPTVLIDEKKLLSAEDFKAIVAVAVTYIEGDERVYTVEALGRDVVRVKLGTFPKPDGTRHGILFMLRRTAKGWHQDQNDPASIWLEK
jgi:hypothetical protein